MNDQAMLDHSATREDITLGSNHRALGSATREDSDTEHQDPGTEHRARARTAAAAAAVLQSGFRALPRNIII